MAFGTALLARLGLDTAGFKTGLAGAESALNSFAGKIGIGLSVAGLEEFTRGIVEYGARVYDLGQRFGVSTTAIQQFGNAAEKNGSSMEGMAMGFNKMEIAQSRALQGNEKMVEAFLHLGIGIGELAHLSPEELMLRLGKSSLDAADTVAILGRTGLQLRPVLKGLADGSIELGESIDKGIVKQLKEADKTLKTFGEHIRILGAQGISAISLNLKGMGTDIAAAAKVFANSLRPANFFDLSAQLKAFRQLRDIAGGKGPSKKMWQEYDADQRRPDEVTAPKLVGDEPSLPSKAFEKKLEKRAQKQRERLELSLEELAKLPEKTSWGSSLHELEAGKTARKIKELEALSHSEIISNPDRAARHLNEADRLRQSIGALKESEKEVGVYSKAIDDSATGKAVQAIAQEFAEDRG